MCLTDRALSAQKHIIIFVTVMFLFGTVINWMLTTQERHHAEEIRQTQIRIGHVKNECERQLEDLKDEYKTLLAQKRQMENNENTDKSDVTDELNKLKEENRILRDEISRVRSIDVSSEIEFSKRIAVTVTAETNRKSSELS
ncbi:uncharacterized protein LOC144744699 [Ciona intestinalis]